VTDVPVVARSPIAPLPPIVVTDGWEVSGRRSTAPLRITDATPLAKVLVRAPEDGPTADALGVPFARAARDGDGTLVIGSGPGEWLLLGPPGHARQIADRVPAAADELVTVLDFTDSRALVRLRGDACADLLAKVCAIDLSDATSPNGSAVRTSVAKLVTDLVRDDDGGTRAYLLHCERSSGQYLYDALLDAGDEFGIDTDGFTSPGI
jgi:heterotetrameric sarcosine oxidase gamma subunit